MTATITRRVHDEPKPRPVSAAGFEVVLHSGRARAARAIPGEGRLCVVVADSGSFAGAPVATDLPLPVPSSSTVVWCRAGGAIQVRASWAPPALLVRADRTVMIPETPGLPGVAVLEPGERLLVLSSSAFEAAPRGVVRLLHATPARLLGADPADLLDALFREAPEAGGAVITRRGA